MHVIGIMYILLFASSSFALPLKLYKPARARRDSDYFFPTVHLDTAEPVPEVPDTKKFGFSFADEWRRGKRGLDDKNGDRHHDDATQKRDDFPPSDDAPAGGFGGLMCADGPPRKRDLFNPVDPRSPLDPVDPISLETLPKTSLSDPCWLFADAPHRKRQESVTEVIDDTAEPFEPEIESTPDPEFPRARHGWLWASAPHKRDGNPDPSSDTCDASLIFKDAPINCSRGVRTRMKNALRSILP